MDKLEQLLERLRQAQRDLVYKAAESEALPTDRMLKKIADLEAGIAATEALIDEERRGRNQN